MKHVFSQLFHLSHLNSIFVVIELAAYEIAFFRMWLITFY